MIICILWHKHSPNLSTMRKSAVCFDYPKLYIFMVQVSPKGQGVKNP